MILIRPIVPYVIFFLIIQLLFSCKSNSQEENIQNFSFNEYFTNPIKSNGADPWMIYHDDFYYYSESDAINGIIYISKSKTITDIAEAERVKVFQRSESIPRYNLWGPHLNFIQGKWYIYYCAQTTRDKEYKSQRMFVFQAKTDDPQGEYEDMGEVLQSNNTEWAIDGSVLERDNGDLYFVWSGITDLTSLHQYTFIAKMLSPTRVDRSTIVDISYPTYPWETSVRPIQEGQRPLYVDRNGKTVIMFSANASWTDEYCLGALVNSDGNFLRKESWQKLSAPLVKKNSAVFGPGGASYVPSPDGTENWMIYHAAKSKGSGWERNIRAQPFTYNEEGLPVFGDLIPSGMKIKKPSGELTDDIISYLFSENSIN
jgi:GH43 family beta-xylosidase